MADTPLYALSAPEPADVADGPVQIGLLAQQVEDLLSVGDVNLTTGTIRVARPKLPDEAVRLQDLGDVITGTTPLAPVDRATTAPIVLTGLVAVDGSAVVAGMRVLVKDQADPVANGIYTAAVGAWVRAADANGSGELRTGTVVLAQGGATAAGKTFMCLTDEATDPWDPGTDTNRWFQYLSATGDQRYVQKQGDTMTGDLTIAKSGAMVSLDGTARRSLRGLTNGVARWVLDIGDATAEALGDVGADLVITPHTNAGAAKAVALRIARGTGLMTVAGDPTVPLGVATKQYVDNLQVGAYAVATGSYAAAVAGETAVSLTAISEQDGDAPFTLSAGSLVAPVAGVYLLLYFVDTDSNQIHIWVGPTSIEMTNLRIYSGTGFFASLQSSTVRRVAAGDPFPKPQIYQATTAGASGYARLIAIFQGDPS